MAIEHALNEEATGTASPQLRQVDSIIGTVRRSLKFPDSETYAEPLLVPLAEITEQQVTNCIGYSLVTSEALEQHGIDHWFAYTNGHVFLLVPDHKDKTIHLRDPLAPILNQRLDRAISFGTYDSIVSDLEKSSTAAVKLHADTVATQADQYIDDLATKYSWLMFGDELQSERGSVNGDERSSYYGRRTLIMSIFTAEKGREIFPAFAGFHQGLVTGDTARALSCLRAMDGFYPEKDARQSHWQIRTLIGNLLKEGKTTEAQTAAEAYFSSFSVTNDSRIPGIEGDILRKIHKVTRDPAIAAQVIACYGIASRRTRHNNYAVLMQQKRAKVLA